MIITTNSREETKKAAADFAADLGGGELLYLRGELGAGKTVFAEGLVNYFIPGKRVLSPTFTLVRQHRVNKDGKIKYIFHADLYRLDGSVSPRVIGIEEFIGRNDCVVAVEWPEKMERPEGIRLIIVSFEIDEKNISKRRISIKNG